MPTRTLPVIFIILWTGLSICHSFDEWERYRIPRNETICDMNCKAVQNEPVIYQTMMYRSCSCDSRCKYYGDCCVDSTSFKEEDQRNFFNFDCVLATFGIYIQPVFMIRKCPLSWSTDEKVSTKCSTSEKIPTREQDFILYTPVTSKVTNVTYGNIFCALCNRDTNVQFWSVDSVTANITKVRDPATRTKNHNRSPKLKYTVDGESAYWTMEIDGIFQRVELKPKLPPSLLEIIRPCIPDVIGTCMPQYREDSKTISDCMKETSVVRTSSFMPSKQWTMSNNKEHGPSSKRYRNEYCAKCNNVTNHLDICESGNKFLGSLQSLFDFNQPVDYCSKDAESDSNEELLKTYLCENDRLGTHCQTSRLNLSEIVEVEKSIYVPKLDRTFPAEKFERGIDGFVIICVLNVTETNDSLIDDVITTVGVVVSIIFLTSHLIIFFTSKQAPNFFRRSLASFSLALLLAYISFFAGSSISNETACLASALSTYYFFTASFAWMLTMGFNTWQSIWQATTKLVSSSGPQTKKFLVYSILCWLVPATMVSVSLVVEYSSPNSNIHDFKPQFGEKPCWFHGSKGQLVFFAIPCFIVISFNVVLFCWTSYMIKASRTNIRKSVENTSITDVKLHLRLGLMMGLTWATAFAAMTSNSKELWTVFVLLNSFQGVFIFVAFNPQRKLLNDISEAYSKSSISNLGETVMIRLRRQSHGHINDTSTYPSSYD